jgi:membrane-associated protease RseP (regulator of RpoE activity)
VTSAIIAVERRRRHRCPRAQVADRAVIVMLKTLLLVLAGLVAGLVIAFWLRPGAPPATVEAATTLGSTPPARVAGSADARSGGPDPAAIAEMRTRFRDREGQRREGSERGFVQSLIAAGFTADRAEWITRRTEELRMEALQAQYDAQRGGRPVQPAELGDADYERYLQAAGRPTAIPVRDVLASSPAERSGLQPGDEIVAYGGKRVFDMSELNALTLEGVPGESVIVDVRRAGQSVQLVMPRGPLGVTGGGFRGR